MHARNISPVMALITNTVALAFAMALLSQLVGPSNAIGVNWGTQAAQNLHPRTIVQMLRDNNIDKVKLFDSDPWTVGHFAGTGIEVMLGIPNNQLQSLASSYDDAKEWVNRNVTRHLYNGGVDIKYCSNNSLCMHFVSKHFNEFSTSS